MKSLLSLAVLLLLPFVAKAQTRYEWGTGGASAAGWYTNGNWDGPNPHPGSTGTGNINIASFNSATAGNTINVSFVDFGAQTMYLGRITMGTSSRSITIGSSSGTSGTFSFNGTGANVPIIENLHTTNSLTIQPTNIGAGVLNLALRQSDSRINAVGTISISSVIFNDGAGTRAITKTGDGQLTLSGNNSFNGGVNINDGRLNLFSNTGLGSGATAVASGGSLYVPSTTFSNDLTLNGIGWTEVAGNLGALRLGNGATAGGDIALASNSRITVHEGGAIGTINGLISGSGQLEKTGVGSLVLTNHANSYAGGTAVNGGTVQLGDGAATAGRFGPGAVATASGTVVRYYSAPGNTITNTFSGNGQFQFLGTNVIDQSSYTLQGNSSTLTGNIGVGGTSQGARLAATNGNQLGTGTVTVASGSGIYLSGGTYTNNFNINGTGWSESSGQLGAIRLDSGATISGNVTLSSNARIHPHTGTGTISGNIGGAFTLEKTGTGTLVLSGNNTHSGGTSIQEGVLQLGSTGALGTTGTIFFSGTPDQGTLRFTAANTTDYSARVSTAGNQQLRFDTNGQTVTFATGLSGTGSSLVKLGTGTLILNGNDDYTGGTLISGGILRVDAGMALGTGGIVNNGNLTFHRTANSNANQVISGSGSVTQIGPGNVSLSGNNTYTGGTNVEMGSILTAGSATALGSSSGNLLVNGTLRTGAFNLTVGGLSGMGDIDNPTAATDVTFTAGMGNVSSTFEGRFLDSADATLAFVKTGTGTLSLMGASSHRGGTTVSGGTLRIADGGNLGAVTNTISLSTTTSILELARSSNPNTNQVISGSGQVHMTGTGNQTLGGDNSYTGGTTFANGTLTVNHADAIGTTGSLRFTGGTLRFTANNTVDYSSRLTSSAGDFRFDTNGQTVTLASSFGALGNLLTKSGTGTLVITGVASYSGLTTIAAGTLQLGNGGTTGTLASATIDNDGLFVINRSTASSQIQIPLTTGSGSVQIISGNVSVPFDSTYSGTTTIDSLANVSVSLQSTKGSFGTGDIINNGKLSYNHSSDRTVANNFSGAGGFSKNETNSLTLTGNNTTTGIININNGTLVAGSATALGTSGEIRFGSTTGTLRYSASNAVDYSSRFVAAQTWRIDTNGQNVTFASNLTGTAGTLVKSGMGTLTLTGTNTYEGGTTILDGVLALGSSGALGTTGRISFFNSAGTLRFSAANTTDYSSRFDNSVLQTRTIDTNGQNVTFAGTLPGSSSTLTKVGTGTLTLNGNTTYDSATAINGGRLHINGTNQSSSTVVNSGGTLGGTGTLAGPVSVNAGGTLAPGTSPGNLTIDDNVTFASGSNFSVELNGTTIGTQYDRLTVNGTVALGNATLATSIGYTPALGHRLFIIANDGSDAITGTFNGIANGQQVSQGGYFFTVHYGADLSSGNLTGGNDVALSNFQPVPEPGTILGMGLLTVVLFGFRFHQRIKQGLTPRRGNTTSATRRAVPGTRPSFAPTR